MPLTKIPKFKVPKAEEGEVIAPLPAPIADAIAEAIADAIAEAKAAKK